MTGLQEEVQKAVARVRAAGTDLLDIEVKAAAGGLPRSAVESIAAFANADGGLMILGLSETEGFTPVTIDAPKIASDLASACSDQLEPPIRAEIDVIEVDGRAVVAAAVQPLPAQRRPCYVKARGIDRGSFIRTHDGDRAMTTYEVHIMVASHGQPMDDSEPVAGTGPEDLDPDLVASFTRRLRSTRGTVFDTADDEQILRLMRVLIDGPNGPVVSLGGLLALGRYPQQHLPQLDITFVAYPTNNGEPLPDGTRFLDNQSIDGSVPVMVANALRVVKRNLRARSVIVGLGREDRWDYPEEAIRELVANALTHRDLHPLAHGTQVRIALYPDRIEIASPGGLHGAVATEDLFADPISSSRNALLAKLLEDVEVPGTGRTVCENRGSGLLATAAALRRAGIEPPSVRDSIREFRIVISNEGLLDDTALDWLAHMDTGGLTDGQRLGLAFVKRNATITNHQYRTITGCDSATATRDLSALAHRGLLERSSSRRWAVWHLKDTSGAARQQRLELGLPTDAGPNTDPRPGGERAAQIHHLLAEGPRSTTELAFALGITREGVLRWLRRMEADGEVEPTAAKRKSTRNRWRLRRDPPPRPASDHPGG